MNMSFFGNENNAEPGLESVNSCICFSGEDHPERGGGRELPPVPLLPQTQRRHLRNESSHEQEPLHVTEEVGR